LGPKEEKELSEEEKLKIRLKQLEDFVEKQRQEIEKLKQQLEQTKKAYQMRVKTLENEKQLLLEEVKKLKQENENLKQNLQKLNQILAQAMAEKQKVEKSIKSLASQFSQTIQFLEKRWFSLAERIIVDVLKEVLKKDELHREEDLKRIFRSVFMEKIVEGEITIRANPQDLELIKEVLQEVKGDLVKFELVPDPQKARGEFEIETLNELFI
jgi:flagellar biosynthesis/type III secretory pathway protein FliH